jgi:hypothetical protein
VAILENSPQQPDIPRRLPLLLFARPVQLGNKDQMFSADFD